MKLRDDEWDRYHLQTHLQVAAELEAWTIPYYMAAMFSIIDRSSDAYQLIQSVVHQEMLHLQLVANVANAYGYSPVFGPDAFRYHGTAIPHLDFALDPDNPTKLFSPYSAEIGALDEQRINGMCLIEYPEWDTGGKPVFRDDVTEYGSIGEFYDAIEYGARQLAADIVGGRHQVDKFSVFYRNLPKMTVESTGTVGVAEVALLIDVIRDQGEAAKAADAIAVPFRNTADDSHPDLSHYDKFCQIREQALHRGFPKTYELKDLSEYTPGDLRRLKILRDNFAIFTGVLGNLFAGRNPADFAPLMVTIGGNILACWKNHVTPKFT
jgi:Ferritin-like